MARCLIRIVQQAATQQQERILIGHNTRFPELTAPPLMQASQPAAQSIRLTMALMLAIVVAFAQWAGLQHGVRHAGLQNPFASNMQTETNESDVHHSCIAFDAAALADSLPLAAADAPLPIGVRMSTTWNAPASWDAPFAHYFSSRAPPLI